MPAGLNRLISLILTMRHLDLEQAGRSRNIGPISLLRLETLRYVAEHPGATMRDIAEYLDITPPSATSLIGGIIEKGQLKRGKDSKDRRIVHLSLTVAGKKSFKKGYKNLIIRMRAILGRINREDQRTIIQILKKLSQSYNH